MKKLEIFELQDLLNFADPRAARNWCKKNNVLLIKHGKNEFAFETNFLEAFEKPFINKLKAEFGKDWESAYNLYCEGNIGGLNTLKQTPDLNYKAYKPKNEIISNYLAKIEAHGKTKAA